MRDWRKKLRKTGGFTLVEMLIVVAIIAILVAVSIPLASDSLENARDNTDRANERAAKAEAAMVQLGVVDVDDWDGGDAPLYYDAEAGELVADVTKIAAPYGKCSQQHGADQFADKVDGPHDEKHGIISVTFLEDGVIFVTWVDTNGGGGVDPETGNRTPGNGDTNTDPNDPTDPKPGEGTGCTCNGSGGICNCGEPCEANCECTVCKSNREARRNRLLDEWHKNLEDNNKKGFVDGLLEDNDSRLDKIKDWLEDDPTGSTIDWDALGYKEPDPECNCGYDACTCTESCECGDCNCRSCPGECPEEPGPECKCDNDVCTCDGMCGCYGGECQCSDCDGSMAAEAERQRKRQELYDKWCEEQGATNDNPRKKTVAENNKDQIMDDLEAGREKTIYDYGYSGCQCSPSGSNCTHCATECSTGNCSCEGCGGNTSGGNSGLNESALLQDMNDRIKTWYNKQSGNASEPGTDKYIFLEWYNGLSSADRTTLNSNIAKWPANWENQLSNNILQRLKSGQTPTVNDVKMG